MPATTTTTNRGYNRDLPRISAADAAAEPASRRAFQEESLPADLPDVRKPAQAQPVEAVKPTARRIELRTEVQHRGRSITIVAEGMTLDELCDLLDKRGYAAPEPTQQVAPIAAADDLPEGWKLCKKHGAPMRPRNKQNEHWHSHNVGTADNPCWCKGYKGADSPGYDL